MTFRPRYRLLRALLLLLLFSGGLILRSAGPGQSCPLDFGGLRARVKSASGTWHGNLPFATPTEPLNTTNLASKYLRTTWRSFGAGSYSTNWTQTTNVTLGSTTIHPGTFSFDGSWEFDYSKTLQISNTGAALPTIFAGFDRREVSKTDSREFWNSSGDDWCCLTYDSSTHDGFSTDSAGDGWMLVTNSWHLVFQELNTPAWTTNANYSVSPEPLDDIEIASGTVSTVPTQKTWTELWLQDWTEPWHDTIPTDVELLATTTQTLSQPYTRAQFRDYLLGLLDPDPMSGYQALREVTAEFGIADDASGGAVDGISDLQVFVLGVKDRKYRVWYSKEIVRKTGEVSKTEEYQTIVGQGMDTEAPASIAAEPPPAEGGSITYRYTRVTEEGDDSPDKGAGAPGSMAVSGLPDAGGMDAGGCSSCGSGMGNLTGHSGVGFKTSMGFGGGGFASGSIDWQVSKPKGGSLDKGSIGFPALGGGKNWIDAGKTHVLTDQAFAAVTNIPAGGFGISLYRSSAVASTNASGVTLVSGAVADLVIRVEPEVAGLLDGRKIQVTATPAGGTARVTYFRAIDGLPEGVIEWAVTHPGNTLEYRWRQEMASDLSRTSRMEWRWPGTTNVVRTETSHFVPSQRGEVVLWQTSGMGAETRTNLFEYHAFTGYPEKDGRLKVAQQWDGSWVEFDYDTQGRQVIERRSWDDGAYGAATVVRQKTLGYTPIPGSGDTGLAVHGNSVRSEVEQIGTQVMAVRWRVHGSDFVREIEGASPTSAWNDPANRVTTTYHRPTGHAQAGEVWKISHADGRLSLITRTTSGTTNTVTTTEGKPNAGGTAIVDGIASTTVRGGFGETLAQTNFVIANSVLTPTAILVHENFDEFRRYRRQRYLDGTYVDRDFACCGIDSKTDREGVISTLIRDPALRVIGRYRLGILETNLLDPAGNVLAEVRVGTNGTAMTLASRGYDSTGTLRAETNALGGITRWGWSYATNGAILLSRTNPVGAVRVELYARDGRLRQIGGSEPAPVRYEYYTDYRDVGLGFPEEFVVEKAIALDSNGTDTAETTTIFKDSHGQVRMIQRGASAEHLARYNRLGQRVWEKDADGVVTLYRYNALGDWEYTATDVNPANTTFDADGNPSIDLANDRVVQRLRDVTTYLSQTVERTRWYELPIAGSSSNANLIREHLLRMDGLQSWTIERGLTSSRQTSFTPATQTRTETVTAPDNSYRIDVFVGGRAISSTDYGSSGSQVGRVTYAYDPHGRVFSATDARQGTTTLGYNGADLVATHTEPAPGTGVGGPATSITYDAALRPVQLVRPDGTVVTNEYFPSGLLKRLTGSQVLPTEFEYDAQGRQTALISWQSFSGGTGKATNRWEFDSERGWLAARRFPDGNATRYEYTPAGRLRTQIWARTGVTNRLRYGFEEGGGAPATGDLRRIVYDGEVDLDGAAIGRNSQFEYDRLGRLTAEQQVSATSGAVLTRVEYQLNEAGQRTNEVWTAGPLANRSVARTYDSVRRVTNLVARLSGSPFLNIGYGYDAAGRLSLVQDGTLSAAYSYEPNSDLASQILFKSGSTVIANTTRKFDRLNRILSQTTAGTATSGATLLGVDYDYNHLGQRTEARYLDGTYWRYAYDRLGQVTSARHFWADGTAVLGKQFSYGYDDSGNRTSDGRGGDALGQLRLTTYVNSVLDRPTSVANHRYSEVQGAAQATAAVTVNGTSTERQGEYFRKELTTSGTQPAWHNVDVSVTGGTAITGRKIYVPPQAESIVHDSDGNLTADGRWEFGWDGENRLVDVRTRENAYTNGVPRQRVRFDYDASGRVLERREFLWNAGGWSNNLTTRYLYDGWQCIAEFSGTGATRRTHVWGLDLSESRRGAGGLGGLLWLNTATNGSHVAAYDGNGSVLGLIGTTGQVTARYEYGPFGELLRMSGDALAADNPWRWGTKRVDPTTDLVHYEYRVYSPRLGRWLSRDPIGEAGGRNLYGFAGNDPVNRQDVLGLRGSGLIVNRPVYGAGNSDPTLGPSNDGQMKSLMRSFVKCACSAVDGIFEGFDETVEMLKGGWSLAKDAWNSAFGSAELRNEAIQRNRERWEKMVQAFQDFVEMMRDPKLMELIEKFFPPEFLILLREPIGSPKFCETLGKLGFNAVLDALIGLATGGALAAIKNAMKLGGEALKDAIAFAGKRVKECTNCFVAGTLVATACGLVPVEEVRVGDWVWARDEVTGEVQLCEVEETYRNKAPVILEVTGGGETLATTPGHPFWVLDHGWKDAGELDVGDCLVNLRGESVVVEDIRRRPVPEAVYNFSVAGLHTYFVGQGGIWVHNNSGSGCAVKVPVAKNTLNGGKRVDPSKILAPPPARGLSPIGIDGKPIELHHIDQTAGNASPLDEMTRTEHRGAGNYKANHPNTGQSASTVDRAEFDKMREEHWQQEWDSGRFDDD